MFKTDGKSSSFKSGTFFDTVPLAGTDSPKANSTPAPATTPASSNAAVKPVEQPKTKRIPHIVAIETPDAKTVVIKVARPALVNQLLSNLVAIPIIATGTSSQLKDNPIGSGPFKFVSFDASQNVVEMVANAEYWEGSPKIAKLRVKTVTEATSLQAELQTGGVDIR